MKAPGMESWTTRWLEVLAHAESEGFQVDSPMYGFGDPTSYRLVEAVVRATQECGAIRHGAECFNFYFPQELDNEFLVVWEGFHEKAGKPWDYKDAAELRSFLLDRIRDGYAFPLNPVWPLRDQGW